MGRDLEDVVADLVVEEAHEEEVAVDVHDPDVPHDHPQQRHGHGPRPQVHVEEDRELAVEEGRGHEGDDHEDGEQVVVVGKRQGLEPLGQGHVPAVAGLDHEVAHVHGAPLPAHRLVVALLDRVAVVGPLHRLPARTPHTHTHTHTHTHDTCPRTQSTLVSAWLRGRTAHAAPM